MKQRGRAGPLGDGAEPPETAADRPEPPTGMTEAAADIWRQTVATEQPGHFSTFARQMMLRMYCVHFVEAQRVTQQIEDVWQEADDKQGLDYRGLDELSKTRDRETKAFLNLATKLRLTPQSQEPPQQSKGRSKPAAPWETPAR